MTASQKQTELITFAPGQRIFREGDERAMVIAREQFRKALDDSNPIVRNILLALTANLRERTRYYARNTTVIR